MMAMTRAQLKRAAIIAQCKAAKDKPLERRRVLLTPAMRRKGHA